MPNILPMIKVIQSNVSDIHTRHLGTSSLFFNKFSMLQLYKYIQKANNKLKGPHHTVLQANKNFIERTLEQIFHCFLICPNNQQLICMYCISWGKVVFCVWVKETQLGRPRGNCFYQDYQLTSDRVSTWSALHRKQVGGRLSMSRPELQFQHSTELRQSAIILCRANNKFFFSIKVISVVSTRDDIRWKVKMKRIWRNMNNNPLSAGARCF